MAESQTIEVSASRGKIARQWFDIAIQTGFCFGLLVLISGLAYPFYAFWPFPLNSFWFNRNIFWLQVLPYAFSFLTLYLLGCWQWIQLHHHQPVPFRNFWVGRQLTISLVGMLLSALPLQFVQLLGFPGKLALLAYALSLTLVCFLLWPKFAGLTLRANARPFVLILLLALTQALAFMLILAWPMISGLLLLASLLLLPLIASAWQRESPQIVKDPWQLLLGLVLTGFVFMGLTAWWSWNQLLPAAANIDARLKAVTSVMRLTRPVLRGHPIAGNAYEKYAQVLSLFVDSYPIPNSLFREDSDRIRNMFELSTGYLEPDRELIKKYQPILTQLKLGTQHTWMKFPHGEELLPKPEPGLVQDFSLLLLGDALSRCQPDDCIEGAQAVLDNLRMLQDLPMHGFATPLMVAYKMERIGISALGFRLKPHSLKSAQWALLLHEWQSLMTVEQAHFDKIIALELLVAQKTLLEMLPRLEADADAVSGTLPEWLGMLPYVRLGLSDLENLGELVQTYLKEPVHDKKRWQAIEDKQFDLVERNPLVRSVLIDLPSIIYRFRGHQIVLRGFYQHLALQAYHAEHGQYPQTLAALAPKWLPTLPEDPYTGRPFAYHPVSKSYTLYSLGLNQQDDGNGAYYGHFKHAEVCRGDEIVFSPELPATCRVN